MRMANKSMSRGMLDTREICMERESKAMGQVFLIEVREKGLEE